MTGKLRAGWLPLILLSAVGMSGSPTLPIWLAGAAERFQLTSSQTGLMASLELGCLAFASIVWAALARGTRGIAWLIFALAIAVAGNVASFLATDAPILVAARAVCGLCYGVTLAEITRRAARMPEPHRVFALQQLGLVLFVSAFFATVPSAIATLGPFAPFLYNGVLSAVALISLVWLPTSAEAPATLAADTQRAASRRMASAGVAMGLLALGLTYMAQGALWTYITDAAGHSGVGLDRLSRILAIGAIMNLAVPITAERVGLRWGRAVPLLVGFAGITTSILLLSAGLGATAFAAGAIGLNLFLLFLTPFLLGTLAALDASGRSASAGPAFFTIGGAVGPAVAGVILGGAGMVALGLLMAGAAMGALGLALAAITRVPKPGAPVEALPA